MEDELTTLLIVDDNAALTATLERTLQAQGFQTVAVSDIEGAERALDEHVVDVLLVDHALEAPVRAALVKAAPGVQRTISTVVMIADGSARDAARALDRGAVAVLEKPFSDDELQTAIKRASHGGFRGDLRSLPLIDMLQVFHMGRRSLILTIGRDPEARIWLEKGEIVHASRGAEEGPEVLAQILETRAGTIQTLPFEAPTRTIEHAFHRLLLDTLRTKDETLRDSGHFDKVEDAEPQLELSDSDFTDDLIANPGPESEPEPEPEPEPVTPSGLPTPSFIAAAPTVRPMRALDPICQAITSEIPGAVATALISLESGGLIGLFNTIEFSPDFERFLALYTRSLFRGPEIAHIQETLQTQRGFGGADEHYLEEVVLTSRHTHHLTKIIKNGRIAIMVVTPRRTDVQSSWQSLRGLIRGLESNIT